MNSEPIMLIIAIVAFFIGFPLFWSAVVFLISRLGGWAKIANSYSHREPLSAECYSMQSGILRLAFTYRGVLKICADDEGLYFSMMFLFRPGHAPFFVPWEQISGTKKMYGFFKVVDLRFQRTPDLPFYIYQQAADKLVAAGNGRWVYEDA